MCSSGIVKQNKLYFITRPFFHNQTEFLPVNFALITCELCVNLPRHTGESPKHVSVFVPDDDDAGPPAGPRQVLDELGEAVPIQVVAEHKPPLVLQVMGQTRVEEHQTRQVEQRGHVRPLDLARKRDSWHHQLGLFLDTLNTEREMFYLTMHLTHFIYGYMASDIWLRTILIVRKETRCRHICYSYRLTARVLYMHHPQTE